MKTAVLGVLLMALTTSLCLAQDIGGPESRGLTPVTGTIWVNTNYVNNGQVEATSIAIANNGNVMFSWEDDGAGINDYGGVWTIYDSSGTPITPPTEQTNMSLQRVASYQKITNTFLSNFRADGSAVWGQPCGWSTHAKANRFGDGWSCGKQTWTIGWEVPEFYAINMNDNGLACGGTDACIDACGDSPAYQLLNNDGTPYYAGTPNGITNSGILMFADDEVQPSGDIRTGGHEYLANGNIVIVGESRKSYDVTTRFGPLAGTATRAAVYKIVKPSGEVVLGYSRVNAATNQADGRRSTGVTSNGFAVRFRDRFDGNKAKVRMFDNDGVPTTGDIGFVALTGQPQAGGPNNDGNGMHFGSNGKDAYLCVAPGNPGNATNGPWITVLNANGTLRWSRPVADVSDPINNTAKSDVGGAIAADGRVIAAWVSPLTNTVSGSTNLYVQARLFSASGCPLGARFVVSEYESPTNGVANPTSSLSFGSPHVDWRGNLIAIDWVSQSPPDNPSGFNVTLGARLLTAPADVAPTPPTGLTISAAGGNVTVSWSGDGVLERASSVTGPWTPTPACSPFTTAASAAQEFYRINLSW